LPFLVGLFWLADPNLPNNSAIFNLLIFFVGVVAATVFAGVAESALRLSDWRSSLSGGWRRQTPADSSGGTHERGA